MSKSNKSGSKNGITSFIRHRRKKYRDAKDRDFWLRWRAGVMFGAIGFLTFHFFAVAIDAAGKPLAAKIFRYASLSMPVLGILFNEVLGKLVDRLFGDIFLPQGLKTARAHSEGESLVHRERFEEAVDWFAAAVMADPTDWEAQARLVEILEEHFNDPERLAEERGRLLKTEGVPEGLWIQTALNLGEEWEQLDHPERAIFTYKSLLWRLPEGPDADEVRRRLRTLGAM